MRIRSLLVVVLVYAVSSAETKIEVSKHSTMPTAQLVKGFKRSCPDVVIISDEGTADYVIDASGPNAAEFLKHYRITLFDKAGKVVFSTDKRSPGAATKEVCTFVDKTP